MLNLGHEEEALLGVDVALGGDPGRGVDRRALRTVRPPLLRQVLPLHGECDGVLGGDIELGGGDSGRGGGEDLHGARALPHTPLVEVDVVGVEVVGDVAALARPRLERLQLKYTVQSTVNWIYCTEYSLHDMITRGGVLIYLIFWLGHIAVEEGEVSHASKSVPGIDVYWIPSLVDFNREQNLMLSGGGFELLMLGQSLH